jgi:hypothetical protein
MKAAGTETATGSNRVVQHLDVRNDGSLRVAAVLSIGVAIAMTISSGMGLLARGLYQGGSWAREALRGGDLVTLVVVVPVLVVAVTLERRGSLRAQAVWIGALAYGLYNYAFYVFGARFNDAFLLHILVFSMSVFALACALPNLDRGAIAAELRAPRRARWVGGPSWPSAWDRGRSGCTW